MSDTAADQKLIDANASNDEAVEGVDANDADGRKRHWTHEITCLSASEQQELVKEGTTLMPMIEDYFRGCNSAPLDAEKDGTDANARVQEMDEGEAGEAGEDAEDDEDDEAADDGDKVDKTADNGKDDSNSTDSKPKKRKNSTSYGMFKLELDVATARAAAELTNIFNEGQDEHHVVAKPVDRVHRALFYARARLGLERRKLKEHRAAVKERRKAEVARRRVTKAEDDTKRESEAFKKRDTHWKAKVKKLHDEGRLTFEKLMEMIDGSSKAAAASTADEHSSAVAAAVSTQLAVD